MKTIIAFASLIMFVTTSCRKNYTCTCTAVTGNLSNSAVTTGKMKNSEAVTWCAAGNSVTEVNGITSSTICKLD